MAAPLKFILALDAKLGSLPALDKVLNSITKQLVKIDPGMKMTLRAFNALTPAASGATKAVDAMGTGIGKILGVVGRQIGTFFRDAASSFLGFATFQGLEALGRGALQAGVDMIKLSSIASETNRILSTIAGPADAKRIQALSDAMQSATGIDSDAFNNMAAGMLRAGFALDKLDSAFAAAADITALTPGLPDKAAKTAKAMEVGANLIRMQRKGGFDKHILGDVGVSEKDFFGDIAKHMGVSTLEAQKRTEMGPEGGVDPKLVFGSIVRNLAKVTKGRPGATADEMGKTQMAQLERLQGAPGELFKGLAGSKGMADIGAALGRIADMFDPNSPNGKRIIDSLDQMFQSVAKSLAAVDIKGLSDSLINLFTKLPGLIEGTTKAGIAFLEFLGKLPGGGKKEELAPGTGAAKTAGQLGFFEDVFNPKHSMSIAMAPRVLKAAPQKATEFSSSSFMPEIVQATMMIWDKMFGVGKDGGMGLDAGFATGIGTGTAIKATRNMAEDIKAIPPVKLEQHSPSKVFERYGRMTGQGFADGIEGSGAAIAEATRGALPAPSMDIRNAKRGAGGGSTVSVSAPITINYSGAGGEAAAQEIAEMIKDLLPGQLQSAFTRIAIETGTT